MKVKIKNYPEYIGPYQFIEKIFWWAREPNEYGIMCNKQWVDDIADWFADTRLGELTATIGAKIVDWQDQRRVSVHIDRWDTWNMDNTLAHIIQPMLTQLQETKHGSPFVDNEDVPEHLQATDDEVELANSTGDTDSKHHLRWEWVLSEMQFAFDSRTVNSDWADQFHTGKIDFQFVDSETHPAYKELQYGPDHTHQLDQAGYTAYQQRIDNGFRLFGKYYQSLWD